MRFFLTANGANLANFFTWDDTSILTLPRDLDFSFRGGVVDFAHVDEEDEFAFVARVGCEILPLVGLLKDVELYLQFGFEPVFLWDGAGEVVVGFHHLKRGREKK